MLIITLAYGKSYKKKHAELNNANVQEILDVTNESIKVINYIYNEWLARIHPGKLISLNIENFQSLLELLMFL